MKVFHKAVENGTSCFRRTKQEP